MKAKDLKQDKHNYRKHSDRNKELIRKSIDECGYGRSVVIDADGVLIAGNGVASVTDGKTPVRVIETDGSELVVVKRTDLHEGDVKRKKLAMADNAAGDSVEWDEDNLQELSDFGVNLDDWDLHLSVESATAGVQGYDNKEQSNANYQQLPPELQGLDLTPDKLEKIQGSDDVVYERIIIVFKEEQKEQLAKILGLETIEKVLYNVNELIH